MAIEMRALLDDEMRTALEFLQLVDDVALRHHEALAVTLLQRTISNARGVKSLLEMGLIVEARTICRCAIENLLLIGALTDEPEEIWEEMKEADLAGKKVKGEFMIVRSLLGDIERRERVQTALAEIGNRLTKRRVRLQASELAHRSAVTDAYLAYAEISGDSAHATLASLSRYVPHEEFDSFIWPEVSGEEELETLIFLSMAILGVLIGAGQVSSLGFGDDRIKRLWDRHLSASSRKSEAA